MKEKKFKLLNTLLIAVICVTIFPLLSCKKEPEKTTERKNINYMYVSTKKGLRVRETPSVDGKIINLFRYRYPIAVIEGTSKADIINGQKGSWVQVEWQNSKGTFTGWAFDAYLVKDQPYIYSPLRLYNTIGLPENENENELYSKASKGSHADRNAMLNVTPQMFNKMPSTVPGAEMFVIDKKGISVDRVKSLYITTCSNGYFTGFLLEKKKFSEYRTPVFILKNETAMLSPGEIRSADFTPVTDEAIRSRYIEILINNMIKHHYPKDESNSSYTDDDIGYMILPFDLLIKNRPHNPAGMRKTIMNDTKIDVYLQAGANGNKDIALLEMAVKGSSENSIEMFAVVYGEKALITANGELCAAFYLGNRFFVASDMWEPNTSNLWRSLFEISNGTIEVITSEAPYAN